MWSSNDRSNLEARGEHREIQGRLNIDAAQTSTLPTRMPQAQSLAAADAVLIAAWQGGDERAAAELVRRHARALARFLAAAGAPEADLDDLVQETFIRAFRAGARFRGQCQFRTWLLTIGGNVLKDAARRFQQVRVVPLDDDLRSRDGDPHGTAGGGGTGGRGRGGPGGRARTGGGG